MRLFTLHSFNVTLREDIFARRYFRGRYFRESRIESQFRGRYFREIRIEGQFREKYFRDLKDQYIIFRCYYWRTHVFRNK